MYRVSFLIFVCIFVRIDDAIATCTSNTDEKGTGERLNCINVTLSNIINGSYGGPVVTDIMIFQSRIEDIPDRSFLRYGKNLISLSMHDCGIKEISSHAFDGLIHLRKLSLPYNNITWVRDQWFVSLMSLEQLDLPHNLITSIEPVVFERLRGLRRLDISENRLTCLEPGQLAPMTRLEKLRFVGNPFTFRCRGTLTLWLKDLGVNYKSEVRGKEEWLDDLLWLCAANDDRVASSEILMKECIILNLFNQLRTGLTTAESYPLNVTQECLDARNELTKCIVTNSQRRREVATNGRVVKDLLRQLKESKSSI